MVRYFSPALLILSLFLVPQTQPAYAAQENKRAVAVSGTGMVKAKPDMARISTGVVSEGESAKEALDKNNAAMSKVTEELKTQGVAAKDIQTMNFSVHPKYQHFENGKPPAIIGYRVVNSVRIAVRDLDALGPILDKVVELGSNQIGGIEFSIAESEPLKNDARKKAIANARAKAELYAKEAGTGLGEILSITENFTGDPPRPEFRATAQASGTSTPIEPGEHTVRVRIHATWALK